VIDLDLVIDHDRDRDCNFKTMIRLRNDTLLNSLLSRYRTKGFDLPNPLRDAAAVRLLNPERVHRAIIP
jgi:hypothetical protein